LDSEHDTGTGRELRECLDGRLVGGMSGAWVVTFALFLKLTKKG